MPYLSKWNALFMKDVIYYSTMIKYFTKKRKPLFKKDEINY